MKTDSKTALLARLDTLTPQELKRYLAQELTRKKLGLVWERDLIEHDKALNANLVLPQLDSSLSEFSASGASCNLVIEGDNFDALRLLRATHAGKVRVIMVDPPYATGNKDWVYNDSFQKKDDRWRYSTWLEFMYQRMVLARDLLASDGVLMVCINDENRSKLEMLLDEVMPGRRLGSVVWRTRQGSNDTKQGYLSPDHEHILVYANPGFRFHGIEKSFAMYSNPDNDPRGPWRTSDITCSKNHLERPNLYYPLVDPSTGIHYAPNPDSVWRYQDSTMRHFLDRKQIIFPGEGQEVRTWATLDDLLLDIEKGRVPKSGRKQLLRADLPNLEQWVGVPVGFNRPQFKRYQADLKETQQPLSSWVTPSFEVDDYDAENSIKAGTNHEGTAAISAIFGQRTFNYTKPLSLIKGLLEQATRPNSNDIVLDFFAGSGTTAHAVMELNAQDGGNRSFIMCSSTEATDSEPDKNLCRDVCAERLRRAIHGYGKTPGLPGDFAYLTMELVEEADLLHEGTPEHAYNLLCMRFAGQVRQHDPDSPVWVVTAGAHAAVVVCPAMDNQTLDALKAIQANRLVVYTDRPMRMGTALADAGIQAVCRELSQALETGQTRPSQISASTGESA